MIDAEKAKEYNRNMRKLFINGTMKRCENCGQYFCFEADWAYRMTLYDGAKTRNTVMCSWKCLQAVRTRNAHRKEESIARGPDIRMKHKMEKEETMRFKWERPDIDKNTGEKIKLNDCIKEIVRVGFAKDTASAQKYLLSHIPKEQHYQTKLMDHIEKRAKEEGRQCKIWKSPAGMYTSGGISDIIGVVDGVFIAIEVKRPLINKVSLLQKKFIADIEGAGGIGCIATYPEDVDNLLWSRLEEVTNGKAGA